MKRLLCLAFAVIAFQVAIALITLQGHGQTNPITLAQANKEATSNAVAAVLSTNTTPGTVAIDANGNVTINPQDVLSFIPAQYRSLVLFLVAVFAVPFIKAATAKMAGGTMTQAISGAFADKHVQITNEISQLKARTGLAQTPAPAAPAPPAPPPVIPLTSLAPVSPVGSLPVIQPNPVVPTTKPWKTGQLYKYVGSGHGKGVIHKVVSVERDCIVTWSVPSPDGDGTDDIGGWSWLGPIAQFKIQFIPV